MGRAITQEKIREINETYLLTGTYSQTAKLVGVAASTVKKYVIPNYISQKEDGNEGEKISKELPPPQKFLNFEEIAARCVLSDAEKEEVKNFCKGLLA